MFKFIGGFVLGMGTMLYLVNAALKAEMAKGEDEFAKLMQELKQKSDQRTAARNN